MFQPSQEFQDNHKAWAFVNYFPVEHFEHKNGTVLMC